MNQSNVVRLRPYSSSSTSVWGDTRIDFDSGEDTSLDADVIGVDGDDLQALRRIIAENNLRMTLTSSTGAYDAEELKGMIQDAVRTSLEDDGSAIYRRNNDIPLHALLTFGSVFMLVLSAGSLALWISGNYFVLSPFVSLLGIVACPFVYAMGQAARLKPVK